MVHQTRWQSNHHYLHGFKMASCKNDQLGWPNGQEKHVPILITLNNGDIQS